MIDPMGAHAHPSASTFSYASPLRAPKRYDRNGNLVAAPASPATPVAPAATDSWARPSAAPAAAAAAATGPTVSCEEDARRVARMLITEAQGGGVGHDMTKVRTPEEARECARALLEVYLRGRDTQQARTSPPPPVPAAAAAAAAARQQPQSAASSSDASLGPTATPSPVSPVPRAADASSSFDTHAVASAVDAAAAAAAAPATPALPTAAAAAAAVGTEPQPQQPSTPLVPANPAAPAAAAATTTTTTTTTRVKKAPPPLMTPPSPAVHAAPPAGLVLSPTNDTHAHNNYNYNNAATTTIATTAAATEAGKLLDQYLAGNTKKAEKRHPRPQPPQQQQQAAPATGGPVSPVSPTTPAFTAVKREAQQARSVAATYAHAPPQPQAESADALEEMLVHNLSIAVAESIFIGGTRASLNLRKAVEEESISSSGSGTDDSDDEAAVAAAIIDDDADADEDDDDDIDNLCAEEEAREASEQAQELAVRLHNRYRAEAHAGRTVQADEGLVRNAAAHAQACAAQGCLSYALSATEGQNIFQLSGSFTERLTDEDLVRQALSHWAAEGEKFREGGGGVAGLRSAPHYTQLVWAESSRIGVGVARSTNKAFVVCNYTPRGNKLKPESIAANVPVPPPLPQPAVAASEDCQEA